ncbi:MAG: undecaprenyl-diphosphate phosphatase, partial [Microbacteriaceae bacterium]|nr:undecaprenyl-diphosphate phosphatase [Microbacteriaceae bacterium]
MGFLNAVILGIVQGLTEFLPISSSAHLRIVGTLIGTGADPGAAFTAIIQLGTEAAVIVYFAADLWRIISRWILALFGRIPRNDPDAKLGWFIILGSIPVVVLGILFQTAIETTLRSLWVIAVTMIVFGILLGIA